MNHSKRKSVLQERRAAEDIGGRVQPGSGAPAFYKGDARAAGDLRVECKTTGAKSYSLKLAEIQKIKGEALMGGAEGWAMQIEFQTGTSSKKFAVIDWQEYLDLRAAGRQLPDSLTGLRDHMMMEEAKASAELAGAQLRNYCASCGRDLDENGSCHGEGCP